MRVPLSWLQEFIPITQTNEELAHTLTLAGLEVDAITNTPLSFSGVCVGEVVETAPHPDADKLCIARVSIGPEVLQIVCGAQNCRAGIRVAVAQIGATLTDENGKTFTIKKGKLRGVESQGMLCGASELQLPGDNGGIMELDPSFAIGSMLDTFYQDTIFEISLTPNLGHCMSILGIAREISALTNTPLIWKSPSPVEGEKESSLNVTIDSDECRMYAGRKVENIIVGTSPSWLSTRLEQAGIRSINTIVDVTNYVMLEMGQPMHAFDAELLAGNTLFVQNAREPEEMITLDEVKRHIPRGTLLIYDSVKPLAIAGVMGGISSSISEKTKSIVFEAADFDPSAVRRSSKALNLRSESSARFEKGIDPRMPMKAIERACELLQKITSDAIAKNPVQEIRIPYEPRQIPFSVERCNRLLGIHLTEGEMTTLFARLEMTFSHGTVSIPSYRNDVNEEIDLIEEIARMYGYNAIPRRSPVYATSTIPHSPLYLLEGATREKCIALSLQEFLTCDLISPQLASLTQEATMNTDALIPVLQPSSIDQSILRTSLMPGMLASVRHNFDHGIFDISAFEIGKIHFKEGSDYTERSTCALLMTGARKPHFWRGESEDVDFFFLKGYVENLLESLGVGPLSFTHSSHSTFHPGVQASIQSNGVTLGVLGEIHPAHTKVLDIDKRVYFAQLDLEDINTFRCDTPQMTPLPQFPGSDRDWTVTVPKELEVDTLLRSIYSVPSKLLKNVLVRDIYESEKLGNDKKNVTLRFFYRHDTKTLQQEVVEKEHARIIQSVPI